MSDNELPEHVRENRSYWDARAPEWVKAGEDSWRAETPFWGCFHLPDRDVRMLPDDMTGLDAIELGCGTGYVSGWMARRGARVVGIDNSERQLETARRLAQQHGVELTLLHGSAEAVPCPDASFDFAVSEYGAAIWCDPYVWIPEAHRLLRPGGRLAFLGGSPIATICMPENGAPAEPHLHRTYFDLHRVDWRDVAIEPGGVEFNLPVSGWLRLFRDTGFELLDYLELRAPEGAPDRFATPGAWARRWPAEHVFQLRKR